MFTAEVPIATKLQNVADQLDKWIGDSVSVDLWSQVGTLRFEGTLSDSDGYPDPDLCWRIEDGDSFWNLNLGSQFDHRISEESKITEHDADWVRTDSVTVHKSFGSVRITRSARVTVSEADLLD